MVLYMYTFSGVSLSSEHFLRLGGIICFTLIYLSVFFTLGLLISTVVHREATSLVLCLFIWMIWTLWIPRLALLTTRTIAPAPSEGEHRQMKEQVVTEHDITEEQREILWSMDDAYISKIDHQIELGKNLSVFHHWHPTSTVQRRWHKQAYQIIKIINGDFSHGLNEVSDKRDNGPCLFICLNPLDVVSLRFGLICNCCSYGMSCCSWVLT